MKNFKVQSIEEEPGLPIKYTSKKLPQRIPQFMITSISQERNAPLKVHKLVIDLDFSYSFNKASTKKTLKRIKVIDELKIVLKKDLPFLKEFLLLLMTIKIKKLDICIEHYDLFHPNYLKFIFSHICNSHLQELIITLRLPVNYLNMILALSNKQHLKLTDKKFNLLCRRYIASCPQLKRVQLNLKSQTLQNISSPSLANLGSTVKRLNRLLDLNLNIVIKSVTDESLTVFSNCLARKTDLSALKLCILGLRKVCPEVLFQAISKLKSLKYLYLDIDPGWSEPNVKDLADGCAELVNLESFYLNYTPLEKMAYNPFFDTTLRKLVKLVNLKLLLTSIYEEEFFEFSYSLQFLANLLHLDLAIFDMNCLNQRTTKRFSDSLSKLAGLEKLNLRVSQSPVDSNHLKMLVNSFGKLVNLQEITFELFYSLTSNDNQILKDFYSVLENALNLKRVEVKLFGKIEFEVGGIFDVLKEFLQKHLELRVFRLDIPEDCFIGLPHDTFEKFFKQFKKREFENVLIYQSGDLIFRFPQLATEDLDGDVFFK